MNRSANRVLKFAALMACAWGGGVTPALAETYWLAGDDAYNASSLNGGGAGALLGWTKNDTDLAGRRRVQGESVDMGCYQSGVGMMIFVQ